MSRHAGTKGECDIEAFVTEFVTFTCCDCLRECCLCFSEDSQMQTTLGSRCHECYARATDRVDRMRNARGARLKEAAELIELGERAIRLGERCRIPPKGWVCSRGDGHDGPCAAENWCTICGELFDDTRNECGC